MKKRLHLFWQYYLAMLACLFGVGLLMVIALEYQHNETALPDFVLDAERLLPLVQHMQQQGQLSEAALTHIGQLSGFQLQTMPGGAPLPAERYELLAQEGKAHVYGDHQQQLHVVRMAITPRLDLLAKEMDFEQLARGDTDQVLARWLERERQIESAEGRLTQWSIITLLLLLGAVLLWLTVRLQRHVDALAGATAHWAQGNWAQRAPVGAPQPLGDLAQAFNRMAEQIEGLMQEQQVMMHALSHEMRTPLTRFELSIGVLERLQPELAGNPVLADLKGYVDDMAALTEQSLALAKLKQPGELTMQPVNLDELLRGRAAKYQSSEHVFTVKSQPLTVQGNAFYLQLAIDNLLSNAVKYGHSQVQVTLSTQGNHALLQVDDDGAGIAEADRQRALMPYARLDESRNQQIGGVGLGLAIVQAVMLRHQGEVQLAQAELGGLSVKLRFHLS